MKIKDLNTVNKTITLPMNEYIQLVEDCSNSEYTKYKDISHKMLKAINDIEESLKLNKQDFEKIDVLFKHHFKRQGLIVGKGTLAYDKD